MISTIWYTIISRVNILGEQKSKELNDLIDLIKETIFESLMMIQTITCELEYKLIYFTLELALDTQPAVICAYCAWPATLVESNSGGP